MFKKTRDCFKRSVRTNKYNKQKEVNDMLKKCVVFVLVAMLLCSTVCAAESTDEHPSNMLKVLGIMEGYPNGTFGGDKTITRAELAAIVCRAMGVNYHEAYETPYTDVPFEHWASGYIAVLANFNIVNGNGDGTFLPDDAVTYGQVIKILVGSLAYYEEHANARGGYPEGYIAVAKIIGLTEGMEFMPNALATRKDIALLMKRVMFTPVYKVHGWAAKRNPDHFGNDNNETLLTLHFGIPNALFRYFNAFENANYETMKLHSTDKHIELYFNEDGVYDCKWVKLISVSEEETTKNQGVLNNIFFVETETDTGTVSFYVVLEGANYDLKVDRFEAEIDLI